MSTLPRAPEREHTGQAGLGGPADQETNDANLRTLAGVILILTPVAFNVFFTLLTVTFEYPDIHSARRRPAVLLRPYPCSRLSCRHRAVGLRYGHEFSRRPLLSNCCLKGHGSSVAAVGIEQSRAEQETHSEQSRFFDLNE